MVATRVMAAAKSAVSSARRAVSKASAPAKQAAPAKKAATAAKKAAPARKAATAKKAAPAAKKAATAKKAAPAAPAKKAAPAAKKVAPAKKAEPRSLVVLEDETPWTAAELKAIRAEIEAHIAELQAEIDQAESEIVDLMRDSGDGAGDDQADAGAKTYEREQELALADNAREVLRQNEHALERIADGTYGVCESCGKPVGKLRLQAFPRATLCMPCKTKQERR